MYKKNVKSHINWNYLKPTQNSRHGCSPQQATYKVYWDHAIPKSQDLKVLVCRKQYIRHSI